MQDHDRQTREAISHQCTVALESAAKPWGIPHVCTHFQSLLCDHRHPQIVAVCRVIQRSLSRCAQLMQQPRQQINWHMHVLPSTDCMTVLAMRHRAERLAHTHASLRGFVQPMHYQLLSHWVSVPGSDEAIVISQHWAATKDTPCCASHAGRIWVGIVVIGCIVGDL